MTYIVVTGMSGAGKTAALRFFEDNGSLCMDNLPPMMMPNMIEACDKGANHFSSVVLAMDVRSGEFFDAKAVANLIAETRRLGHNVVTVFLEASEETLVSRYKETRRDHPLAKHGTGLMEAIAIERNMLQPLRETANYVIDTTGTKAKGLQKLLAGILQDNGESVPPLRVEVMSFGFKRGLPRQADLVMDVRFLPNPFYIEGLCRHTGQDEDVRSFVMNHPATEQFMEQYKAMLDFLLPNYREEGKQRLVIAIGCTGGAHRSVAIAEAVAKYLREQGYSTEINHRDMQIEQARWKGIAEGEE